MTVPATARSGRSRMVAAGLVLACSGLLGSCATTPPDRTASYRCTDGSTLQVDYHWDHASVLRPGMASLRLEADRERRGFRFSDGKTTLTVRGSTINLSAEGLSPVDCTATRR